MRLGVECEVMRRVRGASAETMIHGQRARSAWSWDGRVLGHEATVPVGFRATLVLPGRCAGVALASVAEGAGAVAVWNAGEGASATVEGVEGVRPNGPGDLEVALLSGVFGFRALYAN